jgi:hypothetical protein
MRESEQRHRTPAGMENRKARSRARQKARHRLLKYYHSEYFLLAPIGARHSGVRYDGATYSGAITELKRRHPRKYQELLAHACIEEGVVQLPIGMPPRS